MRCMLCGKRTWIWQNTEGRYKVHWFTLPNGEHEGIIDWNDKHYHRKCVLKYGVKGYK